MKAALKSYVIKELGREPAGLEHVLAQFQELKTRKNQVLIDINEVCKKVFFVVKGCVKVITYNYNGEESTLSLVFENEWRTAMRSFVNQQPSNERLVSVEASEILYIEKEAFDQLSKEFSDFEMLYKRILQDSYAQSIERMQSLMALDALERVKFLLNQHPFIFTRLSNRLIASYLGLSESTLSRLKSKL